MAKQIMTNAFYMATPAQSWAGLWAHPNANGQHYNDLEFWTDLAKTAERGLIDGIFLADGLGANDVYEGRPDAVMRSGTMFPINDPMLLIPAMAAVTRHLCFGVTANTIYEPPYLLARRFSTLDHLTKGRVSWNIVTGILESVAAAMGREPVPHDRRYDMADEYMDLVYKLWEGSWEDDAVLRDKQARIFTDPAKVHRIHHAGETYACDAIHPCEPSLQRTPFLYSAGASGKGIAFAGKHAEAAFLSSSDMAFARHVTDGYRKAAVAAGRAPDSVKVFNAATVIVAPTEAEARDLERQYEEYSDTPGNLAMVSSWIGIDLSKYDPDESIEHVEGNAIQSILDAMTKFNKGEKVRVRDLGRFAGIPGREAFIVGSTASVCDTIVKWVDETGIDGFNLVRTVDPQNLTAFVDLVVPELQDRGYYKTEYAPGTMREKFSGAGARLAPDHYGARFKVNASTAAPAA
ncbi:LLM class flavin-dependent oxidoreductase [Sphingomonas profundi]|uniref:LLM class flavin-dependent oxidoreductase n=1 Tax=Alterirhizorhabdus profundi TaxID=2681549 RepID=UPI0012E990F4|nr:LLM class flavin-dependent oxidoreductase [Sphingomonas profundi]